MSEPEPGTLPQLSSAAVLTILSEVPLEGSFRPAYSGIDKSVRFREADLNYSLLAQLPLVDSTPSIDTVERMFERPWIDHAPRWSGRFHHPKGNMPDYGRDIADNVSTAALMLHLDFTNEEKRDLLVRFVQLGIDLYGIVLDGGKSNWLNDGGHASGRKWPILFAGLVLNDAAMLNIGMLDTHFGEDDQTFYVRRTGSSINKGYGGYTEDDIGLPEWGVKHASEPNRDNRRWGATYRNCCTANSWSGFILAARIMDAIQLWNHNALFDYQDRYMQFNGPASGNPSYWRSWTTFPGEMWDAYRADYGEEWTLGAEPDPEPDPEPEPDPDPDPDPDPEPDPEPDPDPGPGPIVEPPPPPGSGEYTFTATAISQFGITWNFDREYTAGRFANGDYWVVGPVRIVDILPRSRSGSRVQNGSVLNPVGGISSQGFDSSMPRPGYNRNLNVGVDVSSSSPLVLQPGSSLVSTESVSAAGSLPQVRAAQVLTVLGEIPPQGSFRPPYCGNDKTIRYYESQLDYSKLLRLRQVPGTPALSTVERYFERPWIDHVRGWSGRYVHPRNNLPDYGREISQRVGIGALMLHLNFTNAQKRKLLVRFVQLGIDLNGIVDAGGLTTWENDGGHSAGRKWPILFAGMMLNAPDLLDIGDDKETHFGEDDQTFYVSRDSNGSINGGHGGYNSGDIGLPEWGINHRTRRQRDNKAWGADYRQCCTAICWSGWILAARLMEAEDLWKHDALFDYVDRYMTMVFAGERLRCHKGYPSPIPGHIDLPQHLWA
ncbi:MAG: hypothetical protein AAF488_17065 [Planctomycetota bacterium]